MDSYQHEHRRVRDIRSIFNVHTGDSSWPYFVEGDGIEHHVIRTDICRYLSGDALVKKGNWEGRDGFFYFGYRLLTEAQIATLKADSARWLVERAENWNRRREAGPDYPRSQTLNQSIQLQREQLTRPPIDPRVPMPPSREHPPSTYFPTVTPPAPLPAPEPGISQSEPTYDLQRYVYDLSGQPYYDLVRGQYIPGYRAQHTTAAPPTDRLGLDQSTPRTLVSHAHAGGEPEATVPPPQHPPAEQPQPQPRDGYWDYNDPTRPVWVEYRRTR